MSVDTNPILKRTKLTCTHERRSRVEIEIIGQPNAGPNVDGNIVGQGTISRHTAKVEAIGAEDGPVCLAFLALAAWLARRERGDAIAYFQRTTSPKPLCFSSSDHSLYLGTPLHHLACGFVRRHERQILVHHLAKFASNDHPDDRTKSAEGKLEKSLLNILPHISVWQ